MKIFDNFHFYSISVTLFMELLIVAPNLSYLLPGNLRDVTSKFDLNRL